MRQRRASYLGGARVGPRMQVSRGVTSRSLRSSHTGMYRGWTRLIEGMLLCARLVFVGTRECLHSFLLSVCQSFRRTKVSGALESAERISLSPRSPWRGGTQPGRSHPKERKQKKKKRHHFLKLVHWLRRSGGSDQFVVLTVTWQHDRNEINNQNPTLGELDSKGHK